MLLAAIRSPQCTVRVFVTVTRLTPRHLAELGLRPRPIGKAQAKRNGKGSVMTRVDLWTYRESAFADVDVVGYAVEASDGSLGKVDEASYEADAGYLVVDTSSWTNLGSGTRALIPAAAIESVDHGERKVFLGLAKEQIKDAPEFETIDESYRNRVAGYYGPFLMAPGGVAPSTQRVERR